MELSYKSKHTKLIKIPFHNPRAACHLKSSFMGWSVLLPADCVLPRGRAVRCVSVRESSNFSAWSSDLNDCSTAPFFLCQNSGFSVFRVRRIAANSVWNELAWARVDCSLVWRVHLWSSSSCWVPSPRNICFLLSYIMLLMDASAKCHLQLAEVCRGLNTHVYSAQC